MSTKILATLGPSSLNETTITKLTELGVSLFRVNLSHTPIDKIESTIRLIQQYTSAPISLDSEGAQIRNQDMAGGTCTLTKGEHVQVHFSSVVGDEHNISLTPNHVAESLEVGDRVRIDFHSVCIRIIEKRDDHCLAEVEVGGKVGSNKAVDVDRNIKLNAITEKDKIAVAIGKEMGIKDYALSFANSEEDVVAMRELIGEGVNLISKIESRQGLLNLSQILKKTDSILIDRGDLSRQMPIEKIPFLQRKIIAIAKYHQTPVYVATNLLESMITTQLPTRAEVNDVISTLLMGANGLVLAAETAIGAFPVQTIIMVNKLIKEFDKWTPNTSLNEIIEN